MAKRIASGKPLDLKTIKKISQYFPRHEVDRRHKDWGNEERPSPGYVAYMLWGGDEGRDWSKRYAATHESTKR